MKLPTCFQDFFSYVLFQVMEILTKASHANYIGFASLCFCPAFAYRHLFELNIKRLVLGDLIQLDQLTD